MSEWNTWTYISIYMVVTVVKFVLQCVAGAKRRDIGFSRMFLFMSCVGGAGFASTFWFLSLVMDILPDPLQQVGFQVFASAFGELILAYTGVRFGGFLARSRREDDVNEQPSHYTCDDGHVVRSRGEALIDNWLRRVRIPHEYENTITLGGAKLKYDWYLPDHDVYIEYWGYFGKVYKERRQEKEKLYSMHGKCLVSVENKDLEDLDTSLKRKLEPHVDDGYFTMPARCFNCGVKLDDRYA